ncbi:hypothetical protein ViNHUV68_42120 [Vibrio sp. NH-UV-68]
MNCANLLSFVSGCGVLKLRSIFNIVALFLPFQTLIYSLKVSFVALPFQKVFLGAFSQLSTALLVPSGFSDSRFETAPDLSF